MKFPCVYLCLSSGDLFKFSVSFPPFYSSFECDKSLVSNVINNLKILVNKTRSYFRTPLRLGGPVASRLSHSRGLLLRVTWGPHVSDGVALRFDRHLLVISPHYRYNVNTRQWLVFVLYTTSEYGFWFEHRPGNFFLINRKYFMVAKSFPRKEFSTWQKKKRRK